MEAKRKKMLLGLVSLVVVISCICLLISFVIASRFFIRLLDDATKSYDVQPVGTSFFDDKGGQDYRRMALIQPYQAISINKDTWRIELKTNSIRYQDSIHDITMLTVLDDGTIITYAFDTLFGGEPVKELWFIIIPTEGVERGFTTDEEFTTYLKEKGIENQNLIDANLLYDELLNDEQPSWFPNDYEP